MAKLNKSDWLYLGVETTSVVRKADIAAIVTFMRPNEWDEMRDRAAWETGYRSVVYLQSGVGIRSKRDPLVLVDEMFGEHNA